MAHTDEQTEKLAGMVRDGFEEMRQEINVDERVQQLEQQTL